MKEWTKISDLPAWLRVKAKTNIALNKRRGGVGYADDRKEDRLLYAFSWGLTPEGYGYWSRIDYGIIPEKPNNNNE